MAKDQFLLMYRPEDKKRPLNTVQYDNEPDESFHRNDFWRDYARLLNCPAFRRLKGKTQLFPGQESDFYRCRLTHSLEVAQIAKSIANRLNYRLETIYFKNRPSNTRIHPKNSFINTDLVELAALGHDIGHPPFGHQGEYELDNLMKNFGGFEGNAQSLRIVSTLEKKEYDPSRYDENKDPFYTGIEANGEDYRYGLNLTYRSLASVLKYAYKIPILGHERRKPNDVMKGYYHMDETLVKAIKLHVTGDSNISKFKTIECQIMDIADDIAYSVYDLEDAFKGGFTHPLHLMASDPELLKQIAQEVSSKEDETGNRPFAHCDHQRVIDVLANIFDHTFTSKSSSKKYLTYAPGLYTLSKQSAEIGYLRNKFTSKVVTGFIFSVDIEPNFDCLALSTIKVNNETLMEIEILKRLTYKLQITSSKLKIVEYRGRKIVESIFNILNTQEGSNFLPEDVRRIYERSNRKSQEFGLRVICDFIAGMSDRYAVQFYKRLTSENPISIHIPM